MMLCVSLCSLGFSVIAIISGIEILAPYFTAETQTQQLDNGRRTVTITKVKTAWIGNTGYKRKDLKQHRPQTN